MSGKLISQILLVGAILFGIAVVVSLELGALSKNTGHDLSILFFASLPALVGGLIWGNSGFIFRVGGREMSIDQESRPILYWLSIVSLFLATAFCYLAIVLYQV